MCFKYFGTIIFKNIFIYNYCFQAQNQFLYQNFFYICIKIQSINQLIQFYGNSSISKEKLPIKF